MKEINLESKNYPKQLYGIKKSPQRLYAEGNIKLLNTPGIAIIGSRKPTKYGEKMTKKFARELSSYGLTIISGLAEGIDSIAHYTTLDVLGNTIAVLPCGMKNIFPKENIKLYEHILENNGLIISEYEANVEADSNKFLERNRIVAGLSIGVLVVEGGYRSGTSVTAKIAKKQEKNVFCIPSSLENSKGLTPNKLIKEGAFLVTEVEDIISKYPELKLEKKNIDSIKNNMQKIKKIPEEYKLIYNALDTEKLTHINQISKKTGLKIQEINYKLMMMELENLIITFPGNNYKKNIN